MIIPKEQRLGYEYRNYHHYAAIILELGTVGKILVTASILDLSNFKFQEFIMMSPIEFYLPGTYPPGTYVPLSTRGGRTGGTPRLEKNRNRSQGQPAVN